MNVCLELRKTSKGKLRYENKVSLSVEDNKNWWETVNPQPFICFPKNILTCGLDDKSTSQLIYDCPPVSASLLDNISKNNNFEEESLYVTCHTSIRSPPSPKPVISVQPKTLSTEDKSPNKQPAEIDRNVHISLEHNLSNKSIREYEDLLVRKSKEKVEKKRKEFVDNMIYSTHIAQEKQKIRLKRQDDELKSLYQQTEKHLKDKNESEKQVQEIKESHRHHQQMLDAKVLEVEKRRQQLKDEDRRRQDQVLELTQNISLVLDKYNELYESCPHKDCYSEEAKATNAKMKTLKLQANSLYESFKNSTSKQEDLQELRELLEDGSKGMAAIKVHLDEAYKKGSEIEEARAQEAKAAQKQQEQQQQQLHQQQQQKKQQQQQNQKQQTAEDVMVDALEEYTKMQGKLQKTTEALNAFINNPNIQMKKYKFELQKAVNTPINAISPESSVHLHDKLHRLSLLMFGEKVEISGKTICAKDVPEGLSFCKNLAARMIAKKGAEQVSSKHETAFAIAAVAVGLWCYDTEFGELLLAHFHKNCPYLVPFIFPKQEKQTNEKYHEYLGYKVENGVIEDQDKFLKRMSGIMRLYAAILVTSTPRPGNRVHPYGIEHAWIWLTRVLNSPPQPDITATMIYDLLSVTGHLLLEQYRSQYLKLLACLFKDYVPQLRRVAVGGGPVSRLETFIEGVIKNGGRIAKPEGILPTNFI